MLQGGEVDVLARLTTHNMERDVYEVSGYYTQFWLLTKRVLNRVLTNPVIVLLCLTQPSTGAGFSFSVPYLYNGLSFGGLPFFTDCANRLDDVTGNCTALKICVLDSTTHVNILSNLVPNAIVLAPSTTLLYSNFNNGFCNVLAGEQFEISDFVVRANGYTGDYSLASNVISKEPLALVTRDGDARWSDFVNWVLIGLLRAEERNIGQADAAGYTISNLFGDQFQLMFINSVAAVGNYGEMYARHLERIVPRSEINKINDGSSPLIYSYPYGELQLTGNTISPTGTIQQILDRGFLRCGTRRQAGFGDFDVATQSWTGFDVDYCKAISAALFNGITSTVQYIELSGSGRFPALQSGQVDVLCRVTTANFPRDVNQPNTGAGFTFSQTTFYDGLAFGGIPP